MKRFLTLLAVVFTLGLSTVAMDAEAAKRMGTGKSMGTQRQATPDKPSAAPTPAAAGTPAAAAPSRSSWMGPIAGIAAGLGLAALASHLGFGEELASMLMFGLMAAAVMVAIGFFMRKRAAAKQTTASGPGGMQYAHVSTSAAAQPNSPDQQTAAYKVSMPPVAPSAMGSGIGSSIGSGIGTEVASASRIPADFDVAGFERNAKVNFIRLQAANDAGNLDDIRQFTTPEMFAELKLELADRGTAVQKNDVVRIDAQVIEVDENTERYLVSVRFTGMIRDDSGAPDEAFDEMWHLTKSRQGDSGWVLAGIQQTQ